MKQFSLQTGDQFVHQKTKGIYTFDGLSFNTENNHAEVAYHNGEQESFTRVMGEFFGYNEDKTKRFVPLQEYLEKHESVFVSEILHEGVSLGEELVSIVEELDVNDKHYVAYLLEKDYTGNDEDTVDIFIGIHHSTNDDHFFINPISDGDEFEFIKNEILKKLDEDLDGE